GREKIGKVQCKRKERNKPMHMEDEGNIPGELAADLDRLRRVRRLLLESRRQNLELS
ncbi:hypothetical protein HAX54_036971, partial [Datura stramonium]|nr:hypothetical protein [Datura stramonium]